MEARLTIFFNAEWWHAPSVRLANVLVLLLFILIQDLVRVISRRLVLWGLILVVVWLAKLIDFFLLHSFFGFSSSLRCAGWVYIAILGSPDCLLLPRSALWARLLKLLCLTWRLQKLLYDETRHWSSTCSPKILSFSVWSREDIRGSILDKLFFVWSVLLELKIDAIFVFPNLTATASTTKRRSLAQVRWNWTAARKARWWLWSLFWLSTIQLDILVVNLRLCVLALFVLVSTLVNALELFNVWKSNLVTIPVMSFFSPWIPSNRSIVIRVSICRDWSVI